MYPFMSGIIRLCNSSTNKQVNFMFESTLKRVLRIKCHPELVSGPIDFIEVLDSETSSE